MFRSCSQVRVLLLFYRSFFSTSDLLFTGGPIRTARLDLRFDFDLWCAGAAGFALGKGREHFVNDLGRADVPLLVLVLLGKTHPVKIVASVYDRICAVAAAPRRVFSPPNAAGSTRAGFVTSSSSTEIRQRNSSACPASGCRMELPGPHGTGLLLWELPFPRALDSVDRPDREGCWLAELSSIVFF